MEESSGQSGERMKRDLRIESIADHLDLVEVIAQWHWDEWGHADPGGSLATWTEGLRQRTNRGTIPTTYVALAGDEPIGSVTLVEHDMAMVMSLAGHVIVLDQGRVIADGPPDAVRADPKVRAAYLGAEA